MMSPFDLPSVPATRFVDRCPVCFDRDANHPHSDRFALPSCLGDIDFGPKRACDLRRMWGLELVRWAAPPPRTRWDRFMDWVWGRWP